MIAASLLSLSLAAAPASAAPAGPKLNAVQFDMGLASAVGEFGLTYLRSVGEVLELEAGVGWGYTGAQLSAMPKLVAGTAFNRFVLGAGMSVGIPGSEVGGDQHDVPWFNAEAGYEHRGHDGFVFLLAGGITTNLASWREPAFFDNSGGGRVHPVNDVFPQLRVAFGFAF